MNAHISDVKSNLLARVSPEQVATWLRKKRDGTYDRTWNTETHSAIEPRGSLQEIEL